jgi:hypothetical protein
VLKAPCSCARARMPACVVGGWSPPEHGSTCSRVTDSDSDCKSVEELRVTVLACGVACARTGPLWDQLELVRMGLLDDRHTNLASTVQRGADWIDETALVFGECVSAFSVSNETRRTCVWNCPSLGCVCMPMGTRGYPWLPMAKHGYLWDPIDAHVYPSPRYPPVVLP